MNYCSQCGARVTQRIPEGEDRLRYVCDTCKTIHYENPKMVVGCIPVWGDAVLLCRRAIEPRLGKWTFPAGFLENGETVSDGARRETLEEAGARVRDLTPQSMFSLPFIDQIHFNFRAPLEDDRFLAGVESLEVRLFREPEIPWQELAFTVTRQALAFFLKDRATGLYQFHIGEITAEGGFIELPGAMQDKPVCCEPG